MKRLWSRPAQVASRNGSRIAVGTWKALACRRLLGAAVIAVIAVIWHAGLARAFGQAKFWPEEVAQPAPPPSVITNLVQLRTLDEATARLKIPVRLRAVVTYCEDQWPTLFVQDGVSAAYVYRPQGIAPLAAGDLVEIEGHSGGGFSPLITATAIQRVGRSELPAPVSTTLQELETGRYDGLRVRVTTTVRWMHVTYRRLYLHIGRGSGRYEVHIPTHLGPLPTNLLGATVEITGITGTKLNPQGYVIGAGLSVPRVEDVRVVVPTPERPWERSTQTIRTLMRYHPSTSFGQRTKVAGVVTLNTPSGKLFVEDPSGGCEVRLPLYARPDERGKYLEPPRPPDLKAGDRVEILGYPDVGTYAPILADAVVRRVGTTNVLVPRTTAATNVLSLRPDSRRVGVEGRVVANELRSVKVGIQQRLTIDGDGVVFFAEFEGAEPLVSPVQSLVRITGVCALDADEALRVTGFRVLIPGADDLHILVRPPLITTRRLVGIGGPIAVIGLGWVWMLRRQVHRRTLQLRAKNEELHGEVSQRLQAEQLLRERVRVMSLSTDVALTLNESTDLRPMLQRCMDLLVLHLDVAFARAWTLDEANLMLELQASAGGHVHLDGPHSRVPVGQFEIGLIAQERKPHLTNDVINDPRVSDQEWARREGMVSFAGYPLLIEGRVLGVTAVFARRPLGEEAQQAVGVVSSSIALGIERKRAEAELLRTLDRERELGELKSQFVSLVSHEFRTPLEVILSSVDNLDRYHDRLPPAKRQQLHQTIHKAVRRMAGMMEEFLVLGRLETDRMTFRPSQLDLHSLCRRVCDEIASATNNRCPIVLNVEDASGEAFGDESLLHHIFTNLLSNAVKYSPPGKTVAFGLQREGAQAICRIADEGCGIPETDQKHLFLAFHRGSNVGQVPGTGLGLLIVQRCVSLHGGKIQFASAEGKGTTFTVQLPLFVSIAVP